MSQQIQKKESNSDRLYQSDDDDNDNDNNDDDDDNDDNDNNENDNDENKLFHPLCHWIRGKTTIQSNSQQLTTSE